MVYSKKRKKEMHTRPRPRRRIVFWGGAGDDTDSRFDGVSFDVLFFWFSCFPTVSGRRRAYTTLLLSVYTIIIVNTRGYEDIIFVLL